MVRAATESRYSLVAHAKGDRSGFVKVKRKF